MAEVPSSSIGADFMSDASREAARIKSREKSSYVPSDWTASLDVDEAALAQEPEWKKGLQIPGLDDEASSVATAKEVTESLPGAEFAAEDLTRLYFKDPAEMARATGIRHEEAQAIVGAGLSVRDEEGIAAAVKDLGGEMREEFVLLKLGNYRQNEGLALTFSEDELRAQVPELSKNKDALTELSQIDLADQSAVEDALQNTFKGKKAGRSRDDIPQVTESIGRVVTSRVEAESRAYKTLESAEPAKAEVADPPEEETDASPNPEPSSSVEPPLSEPTEPPPDSEPESTDPVEERAKQIYEAETERLRRGPNWAQEPDTADLYGREADAMREDLAELEALGWEGLRDRAARELEAERLAAEAPPTPAEAPEPAVAEADITPAEIETLAKEKFEDRKRELRAVIDRIEREREERGHTRPDSNLQSLKENLADFEAHPEKWQYYERWARTDLENRRSAAGTPTPAVREAGTPTPVPTEAAEPPATEEATDPAAETAGGERRRRTYAAAHGGALDGDRTAPVEDRTRTGRGTGRETDPARSAEAERPRLRQRMRESATELYAEIGDFLRMTGTVVREDVGVPLREGARRGARRVYEGVGREIRKVAEKKMTPEQLERAERVGEFLKNLKLKEAAIRMGKAVTPKDIREATTLGIAVVRDVLPPPVVMGLMAINLEFMAAKEFAKLEKISMELKGDRKWMNRDVLKAWARQTTLGKIISEEDAAGLDLRMRAQAVLYGASVAALTSVGTEGALAVIPGGNTLLRAAATRLVGQVVLPDVLNAGAAKTRTRKEGFTEEQEKAWLNRATSGATAVTVGVTTFFMFGAMREAGSAEILSKQAESLTAPAQAFTSGVDSAKELGTNFVNEANRIEQDIIDASRSEQPVVNESEVSSVSLESAPGASETGDGVVEAQVDSPFDRTPQIDESTLPLEPPTNLQPVSPAEGVDYGGTYYKDPETGVIWRAVSDEGVVYNFKPHGAIDGEGWWQFQLANDPNGELKSIDELMKEAGNLATDATRPTEAESQQATPAPVETSKDAEAPVEETPPPEGYKRIRTFELENGGSATWLAEEGMSEVVAAEINGEKWDLSDRTSPQDVIAKHIVGGFYTWFDPTDVKEVTDFVVERADLNSVSEAEDFVRSVEGNVEIFNQLINHNIIDFVRGDPFNLTDQEADRLMDKLNFEISPEDLIPGVRSLNDLIEEKVQIPIDGKLTPLKDVAPELLRQIIRVDPGIVDK